MSRGAEGGSLPSHPNSYQWTYFIYDRQLVSPVQLGIWWERRGENPLLSIIVILRKGNTCMLTHVHIALQLNMLCTQVSMVHYNMKETVVLCTLATKYLRQNLHHWSVHHYLVHTCRPSHARHAVIPHANGFHCVVTSEIPLGNGYHVLHTTPCLTPLFEHARHELEFNPLRPCHILPCGKKCVWIMCHNICIPVLECGRRIFRSFTRCLHLEREQTTDTSLLCSWWLAIDTPSLPLDVH